MRCVLVSHTHWDREWYRTFQSFRARLVDTIDRVLDLVAEDPGFHFQLDGQTIVLEDYAAIRPDRSAELAAACRAGRLAIGPWYVQPDSFLPSGEAHVRNLLEGRRVAAAWGPVSRVAYTPDSFGHPAQLPQLFAGFGLGPFVYWRGNGNEIAELPAEYRWVAPDGSEVVCCHLGRGYFNANGLPGDLDAAVARLEKMTLELAERAPRPCVLLMNGVDHMLPDANTGPVAEALAERTGWEVVRGLLDDYCDGADPSERFQGELCGGRVANLLPGVWSTRTELKIRNRSCERGLEGWAEPWAAIGAALGTPDERPSLRIAWRELLANQAHDSICGCSQDRVHEQMQARYDVAEELARETTGRLLERIAGLGSDRQVPRTDAHGARLPTVRIAVFNPSPQPRSDLVRLPLDGFPSATAAGVNPLLSKNHFGREGLRGFTLDGEPARLVPDTGTVRPRLAPDEPVHDLEFVARDVPAFGWKAFELARSEAWPEREDAGREIASESLVLRAAADGSFALEGAGRCFPGLLGFEDSGDRGDTYDYDRAPAAPGTPDLRSDPPAIARFVHPNGLQRLVVDRRLELPASLSDDRSRRADETVTLPVRIEARLWPGCRWAEFTLRLDNRARDHRLRALFPTEPSGGPCHAATTFDTAERRHGRADDRDWIHPAPDTFVHQGWVSKHGLSVFAPGLNEAEITAAGDVAITLLRATGWLSRPDLVSRPGDAGPALPTPGAQCPGELVLRLAVAIADPAQAPRLAHDFELGLRAVAAGPEPLFPEARPMLAIEPDTVVLSAWKPAEDGDGSVLRLSNPGPDTVTAVITLGLPASTVVPVRLDETEAGSPLAVEHGRVAIALPPHALRSIRIPGAPEP